MIRSALRRDLLCPVCWILWSPWRARKLPLLRKSPNWATSGPVRSALPLGAVATPIAIATAHRIPGTDPIFGYKEKGKTVTESFASPAARRKTEREIEAFRPRQQLSREFVEVNASLCRLR